MKLKQILLVSGLMTTSFSLGEVIMKRRIIKALQDPEARASLEKNVVTAIKTVIEKNRKDIPKEVFEWFAKEGIV